jgi:hypothetical protein
LCLSTVHYGGVMLYNVMFSNPQPHLIFRIPWDVGIGFPILQKGYCK